MHFDGGGGVGEVQFSGTFMAYSGSDLDSWNSNQEWNNWRYTADGRGFTVDMMRPASGLSNFDFWRDQKPQTAGEALTQGLVEISYGSVENVYVLFSGKKFTGEVLERDHFTDSAFDGFLTLTTFGYKKLLTSLKSAPALYNGFSKSTKGSFIGTNHQQIRSQAYKQMLEHNNYKKILNQFDNVDTAGDFITPTLEN